MKHSLRATILCILLSLTLFTVAAVGISGFLNLESASRDLTHQILEQTAGRIDERVESLIESAHHQATIMEHIFNSRVLSADDFPTLASTWYETVDKYSIVSAVFMIKEDGTSIFVVRSPEDKDAATNKSRVTVREIRPSTKDLWMFQSSTILDFRSQSYRHGATVPARLVGLGAAGPLPPAGTLFPWTNEPGTGTRAIRFDPRTLLSFTECQRTGRSGWSDTHMFIGGVGAPTYAGVTYSIPVRNPDGSFFGVAGIGFNVFVLCDYLQKLDENIPGYAFIIEEGRDGKRRLIAHPKRLAVFEKEQESGPFHTSMLREIDHSTEDPLVAALAARLPEQFENTQQEHLTRLEFRQNGETHVTAFRALQSKLNAPRWIIGIVVPKKELTGTADKHLTWVIGIACLVFLVAIGMSFWTARQVARPLEELVSDVERVARLDLEPRPVGRSNIREVDRLACASEDMKTSLRSFRKYVPADLVGSLLASGTEAELGGERRCLTIYFSDIAGFTRISESMSPEKLVDHLGEYLRILSDQILETGGTVDKYIGDAIMAFWGAPVDLPSHALSACTAAVRNQQTLIRLREHWVSEGKPPFESRIGIHTGEVLVGNIGSTKRMSYTVIGDVVNLASRLEGLNKYYGTATLITEATFEAAKGSLVARPLDWVSVKGKNEAVLVYELLGLQDATPPEQKELAERFGLGLHAYRHQEWLVALRLFDELLSRWPGDTPAREMKRRCEQYLQHPPGPGWDGVHHMDSK